MKTQNNGGEFLSAARQKMSNHQGAKGGPDKTFNDMFITS
jgi:hypothetical protein